MGLSNPWALPRSRCAEKTRVPSSFHCGLQSKRIDACCRHGDPRRGWVRIGTNPPNGVFGCA
jgi:hypothetical protein